jgi:hypothetical protein
MILWKGGTAVMIFSKKQDKKEKEKKQEKLTKKEQRELEARKDFESFMAMDLLGFFDDDD